MAKPVHSMPFHVCKNLGVLLAAAYGQCSNCEGATTYFTDTTHFRKRRQPRNHELRSSPGCTFHIKHKRRTAKHKSRKSFIPDSGANVSVVNDPTLLHSITDYTPTQTVQVANSQVVAPVCEGQVMLNLTDSSGKPYTVLLDKVLYSPHFSSNLLSVDELYRQHKIETRFRGEKGCFITPDNVRIPFFVEQRKYTLHAHAANASVDAEIWHKRFMHTGTTAMRKIGSCYDIPALRGCDFTQCDGCLQGGGRKLPSSMSTSIHRQPDRAERAHQKRTRFTYFGQRLSIDLCGPMPKSFNGSLYLLVIHDSCEQLVTCYDLNTEHDFDANHID